MALESFVYRLAERGLCQTKTQTTKPDDPETEDKQTLEGSLYSLISHQMVSPTNILGGFKCQPLVCVQYIDMSFLQLSHKTQTLKTGSQQGFQDVIVVSPSELFIIYKTYVHYYNMDQGTSIVGKNTPGAFFWTMGVPMNRFSIVFIHLENCEPCLSTYNIETDVYQKLADFDKTLQQNYPTVIYFEDTGDIMVTSQGENRKLYTFRDNNLTSEPVDKTTVIEKYNSAGTLVYYSQEDKSSKFELRKGNNAITYQVNNVQDGALVSVREFSPSQAFVGFIHEQKKTTVVLYSLDSKTVIRTVKADFAFDRIVNFGQNWCIVCTSQENSSDVRVKSLSGGSQNAEQKIDIQKWFRVWSDSVPIITVDHTLQTEQKGIINIEIIRIIPKKAAYIHLLEKSGVEEAFGNEIVLEVIKNLNE